MDITTALKTVLSTMDTIRVEGLDNMDKFVGCAGMLQTVIQILETPAPASAEQETEQEAEDGR